MNNPPKDWQELAFIARVYGYFGSFGDSRDIPLNTTWDITLAKLQKLNPTIADNVLVNDIVRMIKLGFYSPNLRDDTQLMWIRLPSKGWNGESLRKAGEPKSEIVVPAHLMRDSSERPRTKPNSTVTSHGAMRNARKIWARIRRATAIIAAAVLVFTSIAIYLSKRRPVAPTPTTSAKTVKDTSPAHQAAAACVQEILAPMTASYNPKPLEQHESQIKGPVETTKFHVSSTVRAGYYATITTNTEAKTTNIEVGHITATGTGFSIPNVPAEKAAACAVIKDAFKNDGKTVVNNNGNGTPKLAGTKSSIKKASKPKTKKTKTKENRLTR